MMLQRRGPLVILRLARIRVNVLVIDTEDAARRRELARLIVAVVSTGHVLAVDPVAAVEPRIIQEAHGREHMRAFALLIRSLANGVAAGHTEVAACAVGVELLRLQIRELAVAHQDVRQTRWHLQRLMRLLKVATRQRVLVIHTGLYQL